MRVHVHTRLGECCLNVLLFPNWFWTAGLYCFGKAGVKTARPVPFGGGFEGVGDSLFQWWMWPGYIQVTTQSQLQSLQVF